MTQLTRDELRKTVKAVLKQGVWPQYKYDDDRGLTISEYVSFIQEVLAKATPAQQAGTPEWLTYDAKTDVLTIFGIRYAVDLFKAIGIGPLGSVIKILSRDDGVVTLQRIELPLTSGQQQDGDLRKTLQWISEQRWNEDADLDDICTRADRALKINSQEVNTNSKGANTDGEIS